MPVIAYQSFNSNASKTHSFTALSGQRVTGLANDRMTEQGYEALVQTRGSTLPCHGQWPVHPVPNADPPGRAAQAGGLASRGEPLRITALLDARMDEMYVQNYEFDSELWRRNMGCTLIRPENLVLEPAAQLLAGNVFGV